VLFLESREASAGYAGGGLEAADPTRGSSCTAPRASRFLSSYFLRFNCLFLVELICVMCLDLDQGLFREGCGLEMHIM